MKTDCHDRSCNFYEYEHDHLPNNMINFSFPKTMPMKDATYTIEQLKDIQKELINDQT